MILVSSRPAFAADEEPTAQSWRSLFDGKTLGKWTAETRGDFTRAGKVEVRDGTLVVSAGQPGTCARYTGEMPRDDYELALTARRAQGEDFFCGLTFPVGERHLTLICGGWNGEVVGLSCIDDEPAAENMTCDLIAFELGRWYDIRVRVADDRVRVWLDDKQIVDFTVGDHELTIWFDKGTATPLSIATWRTTGEIKSLRVRKLNGVDE